MDWPDIDLTFRHFKVPEVGAWVGSRQSYALDNLENARDKDLLELEEYLFPSAPTEVEPRPSSLPWEEGCFRLFLSHITKEKKLVSDVKRHLAKYGIDGFVAHMDIRPAKKWVDVIESALRTCDAAVAFLTPGFKASNWTDQEVGFVVARGRPVIPVDLGVKPYGFIARYQALAVTEVEPRAIAADIIGVLIDHEETQSSIASLLVHRLATSTSFRTSIDTIDVIKNKIKVFTPEMIETMQEAVTTNTQVSNAFRVPQQIEAIAAKYGAQETVS